MTEKEAGPETGTAKDALREAGNKAKEGIQQAARKGRDVIAATRGKSEELIAATREKGEELIDDTREKTYRAAAETNRLFQEHPIAAVAAAAAAGAVLGIFLPRLNVTGPVGRLAGRAMKAAVTRQRTGRANSAAEDEEGSE